MGVEGWIYIYHFSPPVSHARHYVGWTSDPVVRARTHARGQGSPLVRAAIAQGSTVEPVYLERGTRHDERRIKDTHNVKSLCPICTPLNKKKHCSV